MIIYRLVCQPSGKAYIGLTTGSLEDRWRQHIWDFSRWLQEPDRPKRKLYHAFMKYGIECWDREIIYIAESLDELKNAEIVLISEFDTIENGYNIQKGGDSGLAGIVLSEEHKARQSAARKAFYESDRGKAWLESQAAQLKGNCFWKNRKDYRCSEDTKKKISDANRGKTRTEETRKADSRRRCEDWAAGKYNNRKPLSVEVRRKQVESKRLNGTLARSDKQKAIASRVNSCKWLVIYPDGRKEVVVNLNKFCKENGLDQGNLSRGKHKGYQVKRLTQKGEV